MNLEALTMSQILQANEVTACKHALVENSYLFDIKK